MPIPMLTRLARPVDERRAGEPPRTGERCGGEPPRTDERYAGEPHRATRQYAGELRLTYEWRQKSRARVTVTGGELAGHDVGLTLPRGTVLRDGDVLATEDGGTRLLVRAATEQLLHVTAGDTPTLMRIGYHLGNRHVPVQVGSDEDGPWLRLALDHVLENMVQGLGGIITVVGAPFDPEQGAYGAHAGHRHGDDDDYGHDHGHDGGHGEVHVAGDAQVAGGVHVHPARGAHVHTAGGARHDDRRHAPRIHDFTGDDR